jgi:hypothetical protein
LSVEDADDTGLRLLGHDAASDQPDAPVAALSLAQPRKDFLGVRHVMVCRRAMQPHLRSTPPVSRRVEPQRLIACDSPPPMNIPAKLRELCIRSSANPSADSFSRVTSRGSRSNSCSTSR